MAISKVLLAKSFVALSTTSAIGTGALKFFTTKDLSEKVNEELRKKFHGKNNREVLSIAGFQDSSNDKRILKKSLELRLTSQKVTDELVEKLEKFCKEGMKASFEGITEVYKTLATVCSRTILLESKVKRDNLKLSSQSDISEKLNQITDKHRLRNFISSLEKEDSASLIKACKEMGAKDVFSYEISKEDLADYMTFCVEEKPSVIRFWTGVDTPSDVVDYWIKTEAEEKARQEELERQRAEQEKREKAEQQRLLEEQQQKAKEEEERRVAEQAKQEAIRIQKEKEAAALKEKQEKEAREEQKKADVVTAKKRISSFGFKIDESNSECAEQLHNFKEGDNLKDMVKVCYKNRKFSDRAKDLKFNLLTEVTSFNMWWDDAKTHVSKIITGVSESEKWNSAIPKIKEYCVSANKNIDDKINDTDWKNYLLSCTIKGYFYNDSEDEAMSKKIRGRDFWSTEDLFEQK